MCAQDQQKGHLFFHFMMLIAIVKTLHLKKHKLDRNNTHNFRGMNHDCASGAGGRGGGQDKLIIMHKTLYSHVGHAR